MAIIKKESRRRIIDLTGPEGNAFVLLGVANDLGKALQYSKEKLAQIQEEMTSGDYENLITVFDNYYGHLVDLEK